MDLDDETTSLRWSDAFVVFKCSIREVATKLLRKSFSKTLQCKSKLVEPVERIFQTERK